MAVLAALLGAVPTSPTFAVESPFENLTGQWSGTGTARFDDGTAGRVRCRATYDGRGVVLDMIIFCSSHSHRFEIQSRLTYDNGKIAGGWQENIFTAGGEAFGRASSSRISLRISGSVQGTMQVSFSKTSQKVIISTKGVAFTGVNITLSRR